MNDLFYRIHCFNEHARSGQCRDLEISYYFECYTAVPDIALKCIFLAARAAFKFAESFHEDYEDLKSVKSNELWNMIEPLLEESFGVIEVDLSLINIKPIMIEEEIQKSIQTEVDIIPIRNRNNSEDQISVENINTLLANDQWNRKTENIFRQAGIKFEGVDLIPLTPPINQIQNLSTTTEKTSLVDTITLTDISTSKWSTTLLDEKLATNRTTTRMTTSMNKPTKFSTTTISTTTISNTVMESNRITIWAVFKFHESFNITFHQPNDDVQSVKSNKFWNIIKPLLENSFGDIDANFTLIDIQKIDLEQQEEESVRIKIGITPIRNRINPTGTISVDDVIFLLENDEVKNMFLNIGIEFLGVNLNTANTLSTSESISFTSAPEKTMLPVMATTPSSSTVNWSFTTSDKSSASNAVIWAAFKFDIAYHEDYQDIKSALSINLWNLIKPLLQESFGYVEVDLFWLRIYAFQEEDLIVLEVDIQPIWNSEEPSITINIKDVISLLQNDQKFCSKYLPYDSSDIFEMNCWENYAKNIFLKSNVNFRGVNLSTSTLLSSSIFDSATTQRSLTTNFLTSTSNSLNASKGDRLWAAFKFGILFHEDYQDFNSLKSINLWNLIKQSLQRGFGYIEVNLFWLYIHALPEESSVIFEIDIEPIRNSNKPDDKISVKNIISLLENDVISCIKFLGWNASDGNDANCWEKYIENIFLNDEIKFLSVNFITFTIDFNSTMNSLTTTPEKTNLSDMTKALSSSTTNWPLTTLDHTIAAEKVMIRAAFKFYIPFHEDYQNMKSSVSIDLWNKIEPLLHVSFGYIEVYLTWIHIYALREEGSVIFEVDIQSIRNRRNPANNVLAKDIISLLENNVQSCTKFTDYTSSDKQGLDCWDKQVKQIFLNNDIEYFGVNLITAYTLSTSESISFTSAPEKTMLPVMATTPSSSTVNWSFTTSDKSSASNAVIWAAFKFDIAYHEDYQDIKSALSINLWNLIKPLLQESFGYVEVDLFWLRIYAFQEEDLIVLEVDIQPIWNSEEPSITINIKDVISLLQNDQKFCSKYLPYDSSDIFEMNCWENYAKNIFLKSNVNFRGVNLSTSTLLSSSIFDSATTQRSLTTNFLTSTSNSLNASKGDRLWAAFKFGILFHEDYQDFNSLKSINLWNLIKQSLQRGFGYIEVNLFWLYIHALPEESSVIFEIDIEPIRNSNKPDDKISVKNIISLLENDVISCIKFLGWNASDGNDANCWEKYIENIFLNDEIKFLSVNFITFTIDFNSTMNSLTTTPEKTNLSDMTKALSSSTTNWPLTTLDHTIAAEKVMIRAAFKFYIPFHEDYQNMKSSVSIDLWNKIEPLLHVSFGYIEVYLTWIHIYALREEGSVIFEVDIQSIRNRRNPANNVLAKDIISLLENNVQSCTKFTDYTSSDKQGLDCWDKQVKQIFLNHDIEYFGVNFMVSTRPLSDTFTTPIISITESQTTTNDETSASDERNALASFKFAQSADLIFHEDYNDFNSVKSMKLWNIINPLLQESFGVIEVNLTMLHIQLRKTEFEQEVQRSLIIDVEIQHISNRNNPVNDISAEDIISLLKNDEISCKKFIGYDESEMNGKNCWNKHAKQIFSKNNMQFLGLDFIQTTNEFMTKNMNSTIISSESNMITPTLNSKFTLSTSISDQISTRTNESDVENTTMSLIDISSTQILDETKGAMTTTPFETTTTAISALQPSTMAMVSTKKTPTTRSDKPATVTTRNNNKTTTDLEESVASENNGKRTTIPVTTESSNIITTTSSSNIKPSLMRTTTATTSNYNMIKTTTPPETVMQIRTESTTTTTTSNYIETISSTLSETASTAITALQSSTMGMIRTDSTTTAMILNNNEIITTALFETATTAINGLQSSTMAMIRTDSTTATTSNYYEIKTTTPVETATTAINSLQSSTLAMIGTDSTTTATMSNYNEIITTTPFETATTAINALQSSTTTMIRTDSTTATTSNYNEVITTTPFEIATTAINVLQSSTIQMRSTIKTSTTRFDRPTLVTTQNYNKAINDLEELVASENNGIRNTFPFTTASYDIITTTISSTINLSLGISEITTAATTLNYNKAINDLEELIASENNNNEAINDLEELVASKSNE